MITQDDWQALKKAEELLKAAERTLLDTGDSHRRKDAERLNELGVAWIEFHNAEQLERRVDEYESRGRML